VTPALREIEITPRLLLVTLGGDTPASSYGANCLALAGSRGTLLVDPLIAPAHARLVEAALERRGLPPVVAVALTHHHTDHALGAGYFAARGAPVVAQRRCAEAMAAQHGSIVAERRAAPGLAELFADAEPHRPALVFEERHRVDLGDVAAEVRHLGPGHTPGDAVVVFPSEDVAACGDLVSNGYHFNYEEADLEALPARLLDLARLPVSRFVPGHGPPGGREMLEAQAAYHRAVAELAAAAPGADAAREAIAARFPAFALRTAIGSAVARAALLSAAPSGEPRER
jgi:cyclase